MTESAWWYVLAGFLLGLILSTLWEWAYFRSRRLRIENRRIAELEASLRALTPANGAAVSLISSTPAEYQGPGAYLDIEQSEQSELEAITTVQETHVVSSEQPIPMQPARRAAAVAGHNVSAQRTSTRHTPAQSTYVSPASDQTTDQAENQATAAQTRTGDTTLVIDQRTSEPPPAVEHVTTVVIEPPPAAERVPTLVVQPPPEQETIVEERSTTVVIKETEQPQQPQQLESSQQDTLSTNQETVSTPNTASAVAAATTPATATATATEPVNPQYENRNGHDHRNGFVRAAASAAAVGMVAVIAAEQAERNATPDECAEQATQPADNAPPPPLHSFLPAAAKALEVNNNGGSPQTNSVTQAVEPAGIQSGIQRVEHNMDILSASLKELAKTTQSLLTAELASAENGASAPEEAVPEPYAARNLSRTEYAAVRLMQSVRQIGRELRSLYRGE